jgi:hypothetical protein
VLCFSFHTSYLFPLCIPLFFFFLLANWGHDAYSERFEQIPYAKLGGAERIHFGSFPLFSLRALVFSFNTRRLAGRVVHT